MSHLCLVLQARQDEEGKVTKPFSVDEGVRPTISLQAMAKLKTLKDGGLITAAVASQITDGASACLIMNEEGLKKTGLKPRAKIVALVRYIHYYDVFTLDMLLLVITFILIFTLSVLFLSFTSSLYMYIRMHICLSIPMSRLLLVMILLSC